VLFQKSRRGSVVDGVNDVCQNLRVLLMFSKEGQSLLSDLVLKGPTLVIKMSTLFVIRELLLLLCPNARCCASRLQVLSIAFGMALGSRKGWRTRNQVILAYMIGIR
jgi:hypothetical protein